MLINEIKEWIITSYRPLQLSLEDATIDQLIANAIRYFNNNSAVRVTEMVTLTGKKTMVPKTIKAVSTIVPCLTTNVTAAYSLPMWTLLGVQAINALNTDLIMLSETYKNMALYMGTDFQWHFIPSDKPGDHTVSQQLTGSGTAWSVTLREHVLPSTVRIASDAETFTDNGEGVMQSSLVGGTNGTINYTTGVVNLTWAASTGVANSIYTYTNGGGYLYTNNVPSEANALAVVGAKRVYEDEDITESFTLDWILHYSRALVFLSEGNVLRKGSIINVSNDGGDMITEAKDEIEKLQEELRINGRWLAFGGRI